MKSIFKQIIVSTIILQAIFGFVLPAQAQEGDEISSTFNAERAVENQVPFDIGNFEGAGANQLPSATNASAAAETAAAQQAAREAGKNNIPADYCTWTNFIGFEISRCIGLTLMYVGNRIIWVGGTFLNSAIDITVIKMSSIVNQVGVISAGWKTFRDLANMFFIFILIYIAVATIVGATSGQTRKMLVQVIIVALLINFSMFFTKVVIDASNILSIQFYNSITKGDDTFDNGLSWTFMKASRLTSIFPAGNTVANDAETFSGNNMVIVGFLSLIFATILAFCFFAIGILFIIRFVVLLFLLMLSPLALLGTIVNKMGEIWSKWLSSLIREAIFAPMVMAMLWIVASTINNDNFASALGLNRPGLGLDEISFAKALTTNGSAVLVIVNFGILIAMLIGGLIISRSFSGVGSNAILGGAEKWMRRGVGAATFGAAGFAGRQSVGRFSNFLANTEGAQRLAARNPLLGGTALKGLRGVANSSFDARGADLTKNIGFGEVAGKGGYSKWFDTKTKEKKDFDESLKAPIFIDKKAETEASRLGAESEKHQEEVSETQKEIREASGRGEDTSELRRKLEEIIIARDSKNRQREAIIKDPAKTMGANVVSAEERTSGYSGIIGRMMSASAKKAMEGVREGSSKQETAWAEKTASDRLSSEIAVLVTEEKKIKTALDKIDKNTTRLNEIKNLFDRGFGDDVLKSEKMRLEKENNEHQQTISSYQNTEKRLAEIEKDKKQKENQLKEMKGRQSKKNLEKTLQEIMNENKKDEGGKAEAKEDSPDKTGDESH